MARRAFREDQQSLLIGQTGHTRCSGRTPLPDPSRKGVFLPLFNMEKSGQEGVKCFLRALPVREWRSWDPNPALSEATSTHVPLCLLVCDSPGVQIPFLLSTASLLSGSGLGLSPSLLGDVAK